MLTYLTDIFHGKDPGRAQGGPGRSQGGGPTFVSEQFVSTSWFIEELFIMQQKLSIFSIFTREQSLAIMVHELSLPMIHSSFNPQLL